LEHCLRGHNEATGKTGTPLDFVAFHAKGRPTFVDGHVHMGIADHLRTIDNGFKLIAAFPELRDKPIILGESDPDGCAACQGPQLRYRSGTMYSSYTAASFARKHLLAERHKANLEGAVTWAFEFEDQRYFAGFRALASNGIDLPVLNVFRMFGLMTGRRLKSTSSAEVPLDTMLKDGVRAEPDVAAMASADGKNIYVLAWHYHDDDVPGPDASIEFTLAGLTRDATALRRTQYLVDEAHSNAFAEWNRMGSPLAPNAEQYAKLQSAGKLATAGEATSVDVTEGSARVKLALPRQAVTLLVFEKR
jgi:xylan 1,4-beta-xylosidase